MSTPVEPTLSGLFALCMRRGLHVTAGYDACEGDHEIRVEYEDEGTGHRTLVADIGGVRRLDADEAAARLFLAVKAWDRP